MRTAWLAGLVAGAAAGAASLLIPFIGWGVGLAFVVGSAMSGAAVASLGGFLLGAGSTWTALLLQANFACLAFMGPGRGCVSSDMSPWLAAGAAMLLSGAGATVVAARR